ncbi:hypothetical protein Q5P01_013998 [Channa striata]|uniref:Uncharacterized protein n=1 Tax=Channa striata TaxID=64152 RepID=A0AA88ML45_CHASR|nr:hypothetical protein Q5P01_013998 [Channa striata]
MLHGLCGSSEGQRSEKVLFAADLQIMRSSLVIVKDIFHLCGPSSNLELPSLPQAEPAELNQALLLPISL